MSNDTPQEQTVRSTLTELQIDSIDYHAKDLYSERRGRVMIDKAEAAIEAEISKRVVEAVTKARSKDPHVCEFGHEVYSHNTADGWCCACDFDIAWLNQQLKQQDLKTQGGE